MLKGWYEAWYAALMPGMPYQMPVAGCLVSYQASFSRLSFLELIFGLQPPAQYASTAKRKLCALCIDIFSLLFLFTPIQNKQEVHLRSRGLFPLSESNSKCLNFTNHILFYSLYLFEHRKIQATFTRSGKKMSSYKKVFWFFRFKGFPVQRPSMFLARAVAVTVCLLVSGVEALAQSCVYADVKKTWGDVAQWLRVNHFVSRPVTEKELYELLSQLICATNGLLNSTRLKLLENVDLIINTVRNETGTLVDTTKSDLVSTIDTTWITLISLQAVCLVFTAILIVVCKRSACCNRMQHCQQPGNPGMPPPGGRGGPRPAQFELGNLAGARPGQAPAPAPAGGQQPAPGHGAAGPAQGNNAGQAGLPAPGPGGQNSLPARHCSSGRTSRRGGHQPSLPRSASQPPKLESMEDLPSDTPVQVDGYEASLWTPVPAALWDQVQPGSDAYKTQTRPDKMENLLRAAIAMSGLRPEEMKAGDKWLLHQEVSRYIDNLEKLSEPSSSSGDSSSPSPPPCLTDSDLTDSTTPPTSPPASLTEDEADLPDLETAPPALGEQQPPGQLPRPVPKHEVYAMALQAKAYNKVVDQLYQFSHGPDVIKSTLPSPAASLDSVFTQPSVLQDCEDKPRGPVLQDNGYFSLSEAKESPSRHWARNPLPAGKKVGRVEYVTRRGSNGELQLGKPKQASAWVTAPRDSKEKLNTSSGQVDAKVFDKALLIVENERRQQF